MATTPFNTHRSQARIAKILSILQTPMTRKGLEEKLCASRDTCILYLRHMKSEGMIYIQRWETDFYGHRYPVYSLGNMPDAKSPKPIPKQELNKRQWKKIKRDKELKASYDEIRARNVKLRSIKPFRDPLMMWMQA